MTWSLNGGTEGAKGTFYVPGNNFGCCHSVPFCFLILMGFNVFFFFSLFLIRSSPLFRSLRQSELLDGSEPERHPIELGRRPTGDLG